MKKFDFVRVTSAPPQEPEVKAERRQYTRGVRSPNILVLENWLNLNTVYRYSVRTRWQSLEFPLFISWPNTALCLCQQSYW